jgi:hypothetical protein
MQMALSKKLTCKGNLRQVVYLSEAPSPSMNPYPPPLCTLCTCMLYTYSHWEGAGGGNQWRLSLAKPAKLNFFETPASGRWLERQ